MKGENVKKRESFNKEGVVGHFILYLEINKNNIFYPENPRSTSRNLI